MAGRRLAHPARVVPAGFLAAMAIGTALLSLPVAKSGPGGASLTESAFTATSAVCVTGLVVVDTPSYWSPFGLGVILALIQVGGFGIMSGATLISLLTARRLGLQARLIAQAETRSLSLDDVLGVLRRIAVTVLTIEAAAAVILTARFLLTYDYPASAAIWNGVFHAVSAFNNAGFALFSDNLSGFVTDPWVSLPVAISVILGGLGFPVLRELRHQFRQPGGWTIHTRLTLWTTGLLLVVGIGVITLFEWRNPATLGRLDVPGRLLASFFSGVQPRTSGFNSLDIGAMNEETLTVTTMLMFIGGGSASTAGGIKVTTFALLAFVIIAEVRGDPDVNIGARRVALSTQRQALTVALSGIAVVATGTVLLLVLSDFALLPVMFEATSAFATVGLSTGITPELPTPGQWILIVLMYVGRVGTVAVVSALALREHRPLYRLPEERPIVG